MTSVDDAEGVSSKIWSEWVSVETATHGAVVVVPTRICMPQSLSVLYALTAFSGSCSSSSHLSSNTVLPADWLMRSTAHWAPYCVALP